MAGGSVSSGGAMQGGRVQSNLEAKSGEGKPKGTLDHNVVHVPKSAVKIKSVSIK